MTATPVAPSSDANEEISELIRTLRETDQRLDELTAGQIDTVADGDGRSFLLHHAQDELRDSDAARQAAILNSLPAHVILLDTKGIIVSVNDAWRQLTCCNALLDSKYGIGFDYLAACRDASGDGALRAHTAAMGIRAVLSGAVPRYSFEHACQSPKGRLWFLLTVTPLSDHHPSGAVVMHVNITAQKRGEETSRRFRRGDECNRRLRSIWSIASPCDSFIINDAALQSTGIQHESTLGTAAREAVLGTSRLELERTYDALITKGGADPKPLEMRRDGPDGACKWIEEARRQALYSVDGWTIITMVRDVTERKAAENRIAYLNRVYAMLSAIHTLIVREHNRDELLKEACRIAAENRRIPDWP